MKLAVIAPGYWPSERIARSKCWLYLASCKKFGIEPMFYGVGAQSYPGLATMRIYGQIEFLKTLTGYTHVLYSDAWDVMFTQPLEEIMDRYTSLIGYGGFLMGGSGQDHDWLDLHVPESYQYTQLECFKSRGFYRFPSTTFWMGPIATIISQLSRIETGAHAESRVVGEAFKRGDLTPYIDSECHIFQEKALFLEVKNGQLYNRGSDTYPGVAHFSHGHTDPATGKDGLMIPWAEQLGILI